MEVYGPCPFHLSLPILPSSLPFSLPVRSPSLTARPYIAAAPRPRTKQRRNIVRDLRKVFFEIVRVITFWSGSNGERNA